MLNRIRHALRAPLARIVDEAAERHIVRYEQLVEKVRQDFENLARQEGDRLARVAHEIEFRARRDIHAAAERHAVATTEAFVREHLPTARTFPHPAETLAHALSLAPEAGLACEFGVFSGSTLKTIAAARAGHDVYGFDSFRGLPEDWRPNIPAGAFHAERVPEVDGASIVAGWFSETLPGFLAEHPGPVAFLHLDADLYSSTRTVLEEIGDRLRPGSVVLFDEYFNYPGWEGHEHRAWREFVAERGVDFEYLCYTSNNEQLAVRITEVPARARGRRP
ncbi:TylF/MycF/NovP-related O-methyltransferase [Amycolatopsis taiwanensis]|uniref:TylF/MycF/NovP-related O-methyltransferase n=1 Tax=Amycolatopsis taiwanensis TaxID=342230 RepID=UPI0004802AB5|nr:class I SAM-dependent methyltransferase [Amycolatopsis taiwanensis]